MKTRIFIFLMLAVAAFTAQSCKKDVGFDGKASIHGKATYGPNNAVASGAVVSIKFDASDATTASDYSTVTDASGNYKFESLTKGDYVVKATYTDPQGLTFSTNGSKVSLGKAKDDVAADLNLQ